MKYEDIKKLHQKKFREELGHFIVEGEHLVLELGRWWKLRRRRGFGTRGQRQRCRNAHFARCNRPKLRNGHGHLLRKRQQHKQQFEHKLFDHHNHQHTGVPCICSRK